MSGNRIDPEDGQAYSYEKMSVYYKGTYKKAVIESYWESCKPVKGNGKGKDAAPKAKVKAKAKTAKSQKVIKVGTKFPDVELHLGFPPAGGEKIKMLERLKDKKVILLGLPGAFTPC